MRPVNNETVVVIKEIQKYQETWMIGEDLDPLEWL